LEYLFFFSSRRRHTRLQGDWSSDVCSSDLLHANPDRREVAGDRFGLIGEAGVRPELALETLRVPGLCQQLLGLLWVVGVWRDRQIGRASCRERVEKWGGAVEVKKKIKEEDD